MGLIEELRETAAFAHRVTGCSLKKHSCTKAANEIERLREWIRDSGQVTDANAALKAATKEQEHE